MKLVLVQDWCDEHVASGTDTYPIEYQSTEDALIDFENLIKATLQQGNDTHQYDFMFAGFKFYSRDYWNSTTRIIHNLPEILTIDEWFNQHGATSNSNVWDQIIN